jgi:hypothetical protein
MRPAALALLALLAPGASLALPEHPSIPNLGQPGQDLTLSDAASLPGLPSPEIPGPPDPITPEGRGSHPLGGTPPFGQGNGNPPSVPEPTTSLLLAVGLAGLVAAGRKRRARPAILQPESVRAEVSVARMAVPSVAG